MSLVNRPSQSSAPQFERLEDRQYRSGNHDIGINVNDNDAASVAKALPVLKSLGVTSVRLWYTLADPTSRSISYGLARAIDYSNAGYDVTLTVHPKDGQVFNYGDLRNWFKWAGSNDQISKAVDRWEIGNEVDSNYYWKGSLKDYVYKYLKPASEGLHADGEKVVSAGPAWNPDDVKTMVGYGMLDMVDAVGFHPYATSVALQKQRIQEVNDIVDGRKPLIATEWNVRGNEDNKTAWAASVKDAYANVHAGFNIDYYFCLFVNDSMAGPGGVMHTDGSLNTPFYKAFLSASQGVAGTPPVLGGDPGNSPSQTEAQIALYDADTDRVISGYSNLKNGQVIDLTKLPDHKLAIVVIPSKGATSVKMTFDGKTTVQNSAPYALFGDDGGDLNGRDLGAGNYALKVTPYTKNNAEGSALASRSIDFTLTNASGTTPTPGNGDGDSKAEIDGFSLVNAKTGKVLSGYADITADTVIQLSSLSTRNIAVVVNADEDTRSVRLTSLKDTHVENTAPMAFFHDSHGKLASWNAKAGSYYFAATAYSAKNATGTKGETLGVTIKFV